MAQQLLVARNDATILSDVKAMATDGPNPLGRLQALWTLEGMSSLKSTLLTALMTDKDSAVAAALAHELAPVSVH